MRGVFFSFPPTQVTHVDQQAGAESRFKQDAKGDCETVTGMCYYFKSLRGERMLPQFPFPHAFFLFIYTVITPTNHIHRPRIYCTVQTKTMVPDSKSL